MTVDTGSGRPGTLFAGVDVAVLTTTFGTRLRRAGVPVSVSAMERAAAAHAVTASGRLDDLYWTLRLSLVHDVRQLETFDKVFEAVFATDTGLLRDKNRDREPAAGPQDGEWARLPHTSDGATADSPGLPWITLPSVSDADGSDDGGADDLALPELRPAATSADPDSPFDTLDDEQLRAVELLLDEKLRAWPTRRSRRRTTSHRGPVNLRRSLRRARRSGGEITSLVRTSSTVRPRPVVALLDVSGSMETYTRAYLHLIRPLAQRHRAEVFALSTTLTRITPAVRRRSPDETVAELTAVVDDRFAGTRLASSLTTLLRHRTWSTSLRGAVVLVCSDGWDSDPPEQMARAMSRLHRSCHRVIWVNPRSAAPEFAPTTAGMSSALPHCDEFLSGHSLRAVEEVVAALTAR